ncbi:NnrS family protein [Thalassospira indica]|uniref:NnrS family protein n=1 Tax=Thalassospira indica TaxID=1891279 RepID=A0ABM6XXG5_9PROT|nr:NnrS family protein [Thalassospira indica]AXO14397.1 NnrS family protein [Thalassospira indica]OAZ11344.1 short-chain dehydrogenase [Thalassospira profundimaris]
MNANATPISITEPQKSPHPFWSGAFRPLFLCAGLLAIVAVVWWVAGFVHGYGVPSLGTSSYWHAHEMIFGFGGAAIGGFLLTAIANWTARPPIAGPMLMALTLTWLVGRLAIGLAENLPFLAVICGALAYFAFLIALAMRELIAARNFKNMRVIAVISVIALFDGLFIASCLDVIALDPVMLYQTAILAIILLISLIGGRVIPAFTRNWMTREQIAAPLPAMFGRFDMICLASVVVTILAGIISPYGALFGYCALAASLLHAVRLIRWRGIHSWREPIVAMLHLGYFWVPVGLALLGTAILWPDMLGSRDALHALTGGAMACMIIAIAGRAALGHTGRELRAGIALNSAFGLIWLSTVARVAVGFDGSAYVSVLAIATLMWIGGWLAFLIGYAPVLLGPSQKKTRGIPVR